MNSNEHGRGKIWIDIYFLNHSIKHIFLGSFPRLTGSAPHWQCGGQGFESPMLHHVVADYISFATAFFIAYVKAFSHSFHRSSFPHKARSALWGPRIKQ